MTTYYIYQNKPDSVENCFEDFNNTFEDLCAAFKEVTGKDIRDGVNAKAVLKSCQKLRNKITEQENAKRYGKHKIVIKHAKL